MYTRYMTDRMRKRRRRMAEKRQVKMNLPNILTLFRIGLIPVFVLVFYLPFDWSNEAACIIFVVAAVTDWLDGFLARRLQQISKLGAFLDPVADKLMVAVVLVLLVERNPGVLLTLPAAVIIGREIAVSALREWMAELGAAQQGGRVRVRQDKDHRPDGGPAAVDIP